tara:strand:- start:1389 stop:2651 length:1263 start_codon:yes stop_codon:yes gene_type:complete
MTNSRLLIRIITRCWILIIFLFGSLLYVYGDLDNPVTEGTLYFLYKDILGILVGVLIIFLASKNSIPKESFAWLVFYLILAIYVFIYMAVLGGEFGLNYFRVFKNSIIYIGFSVLILSYVLKVERIDYLIKIVLEALLIAFIVSVLLYWFSPIQSYTGRLFGTFGSPNSAGFAAGFAIALALTSKNSIGSWRARESLVVFLACMILIFSASIGSIIGVLLFSYMMLVGKNFSILRLVMRTISALIVIFISGLISYSIWIQYASTLEVELFYRLISIASQGFENDSLAIRITDYLTTLSMSCDDNRILSLISGCVPSDDFRRFDSVLFSIIFNFGYVAALTFLLLVFYPVFYIIVNRKTKLGVCKYREIQPLIYFTLTFVPINMILQHSFDIFPTNFMYAIIFSIMHISAARTSNRSQVSS